MTEPNPSAMREAVELARRNIQLGGRPFGAVLVRDGEIIARGVNETHISGDPTAHAELLALRDAGSVAKNPDLSGAVMYASGHPCPMCMAAMHLAGVERVYFAFSNEDGATHGLSTAHIYKEMQKPPQQQCLPLASYKPDDAGDLYGEWATHNASR